MTTCLFDEKKKTQFRIDATAFRKRLEWVDTENEPANNRRELARLSKVMRDSPWMVDEETWEVVDKCNVPSSTT